METKKELSLKTTEELVTIIFTLHGKVLDLEEEIRRLKDELAKAKKSVPGRR